MKEPSGESFEERLKSATFNDLKDAVERLTNARKYSEARAAISNELNLFAQSLDHTRPIVERRKELRAEFEAFLPESLRSALDSEDEVFDGKSISEIVAYWEERGWEFLGPFDSVYSPSDEDIKEKQLKIIDTGGSKLVFRFTKHSGNAPGDDLHSNWDQE